MTTPPMPPRPSLGVLWKQAGGGTADFDRARYVDLLREHGLVAPGRPEPLLCGWKPGRQP